MDVVNLAQKLSLISESWSPRIVGELNDSYVKLAKLKGEFVWHHHEHEDELFLVLQGHLLIKLRDRDLWLNPGECVVIPKAWNTCRSLRMRSTCFCWNQKPP